VTISPSLRVLVLLLGGFACLWRGLTVPSETVVAAPVSLVSSTPAPQFIQQRIETIQVGQRVATGANPSTERDESLGEDVIQADWRKMVLRCPKRDGTTADVEMLRSAVWLAERDVHAGGQAEINVPECGISGTAEVLDVQPCPTITAGPGRVVTATFHHQSAAAIDVRLDGEEESIGTTPNHPFWSETKQDFVRADQLSPGEEVLTFAGSALITSITPRAGPEPVFNLEVQCEHVYRIGDAGVLVHNGNPCKVYHGTDSASAESIVNKGLNDAARRRAAGGSGVDDKGFSTTTNRETAEAWAQARAAERGGKPVVLEADGAGLPLRRGSSGNWADPDELFIDPSNFGQIGPGTFRPGSN
jgi:hypothetical protein